jgi:hypothetical protein
MALMAGPAWALIHCVLAQAVTVTAGDRTELRTRVQNDELRFDAETRPTVRLALTTPQTSYSFGYIPTATVLAIGAEDVELIFSQAADASASFRSGHTIFSVSQSGSYGTRNFRAMTVAAPAPTTPGATPPGGTGTTPPGGGTGTTPPGGGTGTPPPGGGTGTPPPGGATPPATGVVPGAQFRLFDTSVTLGSSYSMATIQQIFSRRTTGSISGRYEYGGGIGAESERFLPIRRGPTFTLSVRHTTSPADDFTTIANATSLETGSTMRAQIADLGEQWTHRWAPALVSSFLLGAAVARADSDAFPRRHTEAIVPIGAASLAYTFGLSGGRMRTSSLLQLAPMVDRFSGDFDERVQWLIDLSWTRYRLSLLAHLTGAQSVLPREVFSDTRLLPFNFYSASASVLYRFTRELSVESGLRAAWVRVEGPDPYPLLWSVFVAGTYTLSATYL